MIKLSFLLGHVSFGSGVKLMSINTPPSCVATNSFTVLITVWAKDNADIFRNALDSIYTNSLAPTEVLLVIDGPVGDELQRVIQGFAGRQGFRSVQLMRNSGLAAALNFGLEIIETEVVVRADADDINLPHRFCQLLAKVNEGYSLVGSFIDEVSANGKFIGTRAVPLEEAEIKKFALSRNPFNHMTVAYRRTYAIDVGGYPHLYLKEDYGLWIKLLALGIRAVNIKESLVRATVNQGFYGRRGGLKYVRSEFALQRFMVEYGRKSATVAALHFLARSLVFILPSWVRAKVYKHLLRSR